MLIYTCICAHGAVDSIKASEAFDLGSTPSGRTNIRRLHMTKRTKIWSTVIISIVLLLFTSSIVFWGIILYKRARGTKQNYEALLGGANKVVLFIGDGMGDNHIKTASSYLEREIFFTSFETSGHCTTYSNAILSPTDSAAAASALSTGQKYDNKEVARHKGKNITTISELAIAKGYNVGIVTTDSLDGATPACFSSHANKRGDSDEIIKVQIASNIRLFLGGGKFTYDRFKEGFESAGYTYTSDYSNLSTENDKIIGTFASVEANNGTNEAPTLEMLTKFAIGYMEVNCPDGYFLMIEGAHIDKYSHDKEVFGMIEYLGNFDDSIKYTYDTIGSNEKTAIIVTADHETGGLNYKGQTKSQINNKMYSRWGHTSREVPYYVHLQNSNIKPENIFRKVIDNTDIFRMCKALLNV